MPAENSTMKFTCIGGCGKQVDRLACPDHQDLADEAINAWADGLPYSSDPVGQGEIDLGGLLYMAESNGY